MDDDFNFGDVLAGSAQEARQAGDVLATLSDGGKRLLDRISGRRAAAASAFA
jgi:alkylated DNA nucleotide flippase Atl1